jgi:hypothetical protein
LEQVLEVVQKDWLVAVVAVIVAVILFKIAKSMVRWVLIIAIAGGLIYFGATYDNGKYLEQAKHWINQATEYTQEQAIQGLTDEVKSARYTVKDDQTYEVKTTNVTLRGKLGSDEAVIMYKNQQFTISMNEALRRFVEQAQANGR